MMERVFAAIVLAVCLLLALRMVIGPRRRYRFDAAMRRLGIRFQRAGAATRRLTSSVWHWRDGRRNAKRARQMADEAIKRARGRVVDREGNVYSPKSFRKPPRDKMH